MEKSGSSEVQESCHYNNDTLLSSTYAFDWTSGLPDFRTSPILIHPLFMFARLLAEAVPRTEDASRTTGVCFAHRVSLPYRKSLFFTPNASEDVSRTPGGLFEHRMLIPYRRSLFFTPNASEDASRTTEGGFRAPNISSVPEKPIFYTECL